MSSLQDTRSKNTQRNLNGVRSDAENEVRLGTSFVVSAINVPLAVDAEFWFLFKPNTDVIIEARLREVVTVQQYEGVIGAITEEVVWDQDAAGVQQLQALNANRFPSLKFATRTSVFIVPAAAIIDQGIVIETLTTKGGNISEVDPLIFAPNVWFGIKLTNPSQAGEEAATMDLQARWSEIPPGAVALEEPTTPPIIPEPPDTVIEVPGVITTNFGPINRNEFKQGELVTTASIANARLDLTSTSSVSTTIEVQLQVTPFDSRIHTRTLAAGATTQIFYGTLDTSETNPMVLTITSRADGTDIGLVQMVDQS